MKYDRSRSVIIIQVCSCFVFCPACGGMMCFLYGEKGKAYLWKGARPLRGGSCDKVTA